MGFKELMAELDEKNIAQKIMLRHDETRMSYSLQSNTVKDFNEFTDRITQYYAYHFSTCVANGGRMSKFEAASAAKELLEREYRRRGGDIVAAYADAKDGTNNGMRGILDMISDALRGESVERHIRDAFDRHVAPNSWEQRVEIIRQFVDHCGALLGSSISGPVERYCGNYRDLINAYRSGLQRTSSIFRRL